MSFKLCVGLDLGSDTMKIAYAYRSGMEFTGKIVPTPMSTGAIPATAYYDFEENKWLFGEDIDTVGDKSFISVVKIKKLLSLLLPCKDPKVTAKNKEFYYSSYEFPKFYFPVKKKFSENYHESVKNNMTFRSDGITPAELCGMFFRYCADIVGRRAHILAQKWGEANAEIIPSIVYPQYVSADYVDELKRLTAAAFGIEPDSVLSMTKSLCAYAKHTKRIKIDESALIFNIGEEQISVVKANIFKNGIAVDGADGHSAPAMLGGNDIDDAVAEYLERNMSGRETMGRPSSGEDGHIAESSLNAKQYLFVKDIKAAKVIFGMPAGRNGFFKDGVPVSISRDLLIQRNISWGQFLDCIGITSDSGVVRRISDYIEDEVTRPINSNVKRIFITGGPVETYKLTEYIRGRIERLGVKVCTFENDDAYYLGLENDGFNIMSHEDALYAPALGCALASLNKINIETVLALSYGLRLFLYEGETPYLELLVNKGDVLPPQGAKYFTPRPEERIGITTARNSINSAPMHIMSTFLTKADIENRHGDGNLTYVRTASGNNYLKTDTDDRALMNKLKEYAGLKVLNGDINDLQSGGRIYYYYERTRIRLIDKVYAVIGVQIDGEGRARPFAENDVKRNGQERVTIEYLWDVKVKGRLVHSAGYRESVYKKDIVFDFDIDDIVMS